MTDGLGRPVEYMRISITDRCNLRCRYCMPEDLPMISHSDILRYEEILRICEAAVSLGISHFKVTGGEPLVRKGCTDFLSRLKGLPGVEYVSITTNGVLLEPVAGQLAGMGLDGVNISLDTLDAGIYRQLAGQDWLAAVLKSLRAAVAAGLRVKVNCVPLAGINDSGLAGLAALAGEMPVDVRFIELMPMACGAHFRPVPGERVRMLLKGIYPDLHPVEGRRGWGPARYYGAGGLLGRIGFIDALDGHFCGSCNRVRLTSEGFLRLCLHSEDGISLRDLLRAGGEKDTLAAAMSGAIGRKPAGHGLGGRDSGRGQMSRIGG